MKVYLDMCAIQRPLDTPSQVLVLLEAEAVLAWAKGIINMTASAKERAGQFLRHGIKPLDALHLALAEAGGADYFCTSDDRLRRQTKYIEHLTTKVVSPPNSSFTSNI